MSTYTYSVEGMSCGHCVAAVESSVSKVPGVSGVSVDLGARTVIVTATVRDDDAVRAAVAEAGYTVVS
jgi:copper chaperone